MQPSPIKPNPIRVETALSRYPVHRLAKHGDIAIDIQEKNESGEVSIKWEVSHNSKYGQAGPLAYKLDTLIINRRIEEAPRPVPRVIRLGSYGDICKELELAEGGRTFEQHRKALHQNASSYITANIRYRANDGTERSIEIGDTRYAVVFTGEELPDGRTADAVYIVLHDFYRKIIDSSIARPLDYDYLKSLPPAPQRFYELLSYQMYAAIKNDRPRARLLYSELCRYAPLTRQSDWNVVRPQLARVHAPHKKSGYIGRVDFQETADGEGRPDWVMLYQPGPKARAEFGAFTGRGVSPAPKMGLPGVDAVETAEIERELIRRGVTPATAAELIRQHGEEAVAVQIEHLDWQVEKKPGKIADPAAWLVSAIKTGHAAPKGFESQAERQWREEAKQAKERQAAEARRRKREEEAEVRRQKELVSGYWDGLTEEQRAEHDAAAIARADAEDRKLIEAGPMRRFGLALLRDKYTRELLRARGELPADGP
jgi:hypothetical protein